MSHESPAKFFVNSGLVSDPRDMYHLLRPLLKQTVAYRYSRSGSVVSFGAGWVERILVERPGVSSFFTPLSICINVDSFEHLEFETRPDQLIRYTLVQGDERVVLDFLPVPGAGGEEAPVQEVLQFAPAHEYVQMELTSLEAAEGGRAEGGRAAGAGSDGG